MTMAMAAAKDLRSSATTSWRAIPTLVKLAPLIAAVAYLPIALDDIYLRDIFTYIALYVMLGMGMNIVVGYAGLLDLGYIAFYGISAYTIACITAEFAIGPFWAAFPIAILLTTFFGILLGAPTLRLRPDYLAMVTLGFGEITRLAFLNLDMITGGPPGITGIPRPDLGFLKINSAAELYWVIVAAAIVITAMTARFGDSRIGRAWACLREDEIAAEASGIDTVRMKLLAFALGAAIAGVSGALFATKMTMVAPESFTWWESLVVLIIVVLGGMGSIPGVVLGATVMVSLPELLRGFADYRMLILGIVLILLALFRPKGLWPAAQRRGFSSNTAAADCGSLAEAFRPVPAQQARHPDQALGSLLEVRDLSKSFGGVAALADVSLDIAAGEIVSLIGPNGAGKTTLLNVITGVYPPTTGSILLCGDKITGLRPNRIVALGVARTFQNIRLFADLTVIENVAAGLHCRARSGPLSAVIRGRAQRSEEGRIWARSLELLSEVGLLDRAQDVARTLPYGDQRRLEIARALATSPRLLVLDEPAAGLSVAERSDLMQLVKSLRDHGLTVLLIEHDMDFVMAISDRVFVLNFGREISRGTPDEVQDDPAVIEAYLGRAEED
jgi:branched-chain amino acid transport system permease protein